jgi:hypothetical protein
MPNANYFRALPLSDADRYCWIRANRGNFAITEALCGSDRDSVFDAKIEAAMRTAAAGRRYYAVQPLSNATVQERLLAALKL